MISPPPTTAHLARHVVTVVVLGAHGVALAAAAAAARVDAPVLVLAAVAAAALHFRQTTEIFSLKTRNIFLPHLQYPVLAWHCWLTAPEGWQPHSLQPAAEKP